MAVILSATNSLNWFRERFASETSLGEIETISFPVHPPVRMGLSSCLTSTVRGLHTVIRMPEAHCLVFLPFTAEEMYSGAFMKELPSRLGRELISYRDWEHL
jgi:hypothetical protein